MRRLGITVGSLVLIAALRMAYASDAGRQIQTLVVEQSHRTCQLGPLTILPGSHEPAFHAAEAPTAPGDVTHNGDRRPLSFSLRAWTWTVRGEQP